jgi:(p)ppGpp synthase/HD superfamily hydrolase
MVTAIVLEDDPVEDLAIAALLHDGPEDQGGKPTLMLIQEQFGPRVAEIVLECSDTFRVPKPKWLSRKALPGPASKGRGSPNSAG